MSTSPTAQQPTALSRNPSRNSTLSPSAHTVEMKNVSLATPEEDKNVEVPGAAAQPAAAGPAAVAGPGGAVPLIQLSKVSPFLLFPRCICLASSICPSHSQAKFALVFGSMMLAVFLYSCVLPQLRVHSKGLTFSQSQRMSSLILLLWILCRLDQLIVSTAIPFIVSEFDSLSQVAWIVSSNPLVLLRQVQVC